MMMKEKKMYVKIDLYSGESTIVEDNEELREHLDNAECVKGAVNTWLSEEMIVINTSLLKTGHYTK